MVCPNCQRLCVVTHTKVVSDSRVRYYGCRRCRYRPDDNVRTVPLIYAPRKNFRPECYQ